MSLLRHCVGSNLRGTQVGNRAASRAQPRFFWCAHSLGADPVIITTVVDDEIVGALTFQVGHECGWLCRPNTGTVIRTQAERKIILAPKAILSRSATRLARTAGCIEQIGGGRAGGGFGHPSIAISARGDIVRRKWSFEGRQSAILVALKSVSRPTFSCLIWS